MTRRERSARSRRKGKGRKGISQRQILMVVGAAVLVALILVVLSSGILGQATPPPLAPELAAGTTKGSEDAPVTMEEFSDFQ
ncbi:MAG: hypothetical protein ACE5NP_01900 [Anaerolineae bacterium]